MPNPFKHDWAFRGPPRRQYDALNESDREVVDLLVDYLCIDPEIDRVYKFRFIMEPAIARLLRKDGWDIAYDVVPPFIVVLLGITRTRRPQ